MKSEIIYESETLSRCILGSFGTHNSFAKAMGLSANSLSSRLHNRTEWKYSEIIKAISLLGLNHETGDIERCFFSTAVGDQAKKETA